MALTLEEVTALLAQPSGPHSGGSEGISDQESWRTARLRQVLEKAEKAWLGVSHESLALAAEAVADAARDPSWRPPVGESGLLGFFLDNVISAQGLGLRLKKQSLRLIGNACAECDENKTRVVQSGKLGSVIIKYLHDDDSLLSFVISVIYNICVENEPAQLQACEAGLSKKLVEILSGLRLLQCQPSLGIIIQLLEQLVTQDAEQKVADLSTPGLLLRVATSKTYEPDLEDFTGLCTVALAYLTYEQFQTALVESDNFAVLQQAFYDSYTNFDIANADPDVAEQLKQVWNASVTIYADISALPAFAARYSIDSPVVQRLITWLSSAPSYSHLQTAACLSLGNLSRSDAASVTLAPSIRESLLAILSRAVPTPSSHVPISERPPAQLLHAVLAFLKNLAIPTVNKPLLSAGLLDPPDGILPRLWTSTAAQPQVQFATISLTRLLVVNNPPAVKQLCTPLSLARDGDAYTARDGPARSQLHILMDVALRADAEPSKMEAGRTVCAVIRVLQSISGSGSGSGEGTLDDSWTWGIQVDETQSPRARFYAAHADPIAKALGGLLMQPKFPALRSEALFVLALMGRSSDGGSVAMRVLEPAGACRVLVQAVVGREVSDEELGESQGSESVAEEMAEQETVAPAVDTGLVDGLGLEPQHGDAKPSASMARIDRENGLVLVAEVIRGFSDKLTPGRKKVFENVLSEGGELILEERKSQ